MTELIARVATSTTTATVAALGAVGAEVGDRGVLVVGEGGLDAAAGAQLRAALAGGDVAVVLAQAPDAGPAYPVPVTFETIATGGPAALRSTTGHGAIPSLPRRAVLVDEDSTIGATTALSGTGGRPFPDTPVVVVDQAMPEGATPMATATATATATVVGATTVGQGRLIFCQYRLVVAANAGDVTARGVLVDLLRWATVPRPVMAVERTTTSDGRALRLYSWTDGVAR